LLTIYLKVSKNSHKKSLINCTIVLDTKLELLGLEPRKRNKHGFQPKVLDNSLEV